MMIQHSWRKGPSLHTGMRLAKAKLCDHKIHLNHTLPTLRTSYSHVNAVRGEVRRNPDPDLRLLHFSSSEIRQVPESLLPAYQQPITTSLQKPELARIPRSPQGRHPWKLCGQTPLFTKGLFVQAQDFGRQAFCPSRWRPDRRGGPKKAEVFPEVTQ